MISQHPSARRLPYAPGTLWIQPAHDFGNFRAIPGDKHFPARLQKRIDPLPGIRNEAGSGPCGFEHASGWGEAVPGHTFAANIQNHSPGTIESVVICRIYVADVGDVR